MPKPVLTLATVSIAAPAPKVFAAACGCDIPAVFKAQGAIPGVLKVDKHQGAWSAPGQMRLLTLSDGSSVHEELISFDKDQGYAYRVSGFTGPFAALVAEGRGEWRFTPTGADETRVDWTYSFTPKSALAAPAVWFIVNVLWPGYIRAALSRLKSQIEGTAAS
ncbi:MAG: SRPBCC family protein [Parvularculaceae bacterium]